MCVGERERRIRVGRVEFIKESELVFHYRGWSLSRYFGGGRWSGTIFILCLYCQGELCFQSPACLWNSIYGYNHFTSGCPKTQTQTWILAPYSPKRRPVGFAFIIILGRFHRRKYCASLTEPSRAWEIARVAMEEITWQPVDTESLRLMCSTPQYSKEWGSQNNSVWLPDSPHWQLYLTTLLG